MNRTAKSRNNNPTTKETTMGQKIKMDIKQLMCRLTEEELEQESKHLTGLLTEKMNLEIEKSSSARHYSDAIKSVDLKIEKQIPIVRDRQIERDVECRIEFNTPEPGKKTVTRLDTMEVIFEGQMTDSECQDLFINNGADEADEADDENAQGQKLLAAPIDAEEVIDGEVVGIGDGEETDESDLTDETDRSDKSDDRKAKRRSSRKRRDSVKEG